MGAPEDAEEQETSVQPVSGGDVVIKDGRVVVEFTLADSLVRIEKGMSAGFSALRTALSRKADKSDLAEINATLRTHSDDLSSLKSWRHDQEVAAAVHAQRDAEERARRSRRWSIREKTLAAATGAALAAAAFLGVFFH